MQKALAQNPNLLRTLLGLSFTLIFLLGYAVYGATISPSYYLYTTETETTIHDTNEPTKLYDEDNNVTNWRWTFTADGDNLTWVNASAGGLSRNSVKPVLLVCTATLTLVIPMRMILVVLTNATITTHMN